MLAPGTDWHIFVSNYLQFVAKVFNSLSPLRLPWPGQVPAPAPPPPRGAAEVLAASWSRLGVFGQLSYLPHLYSISTITAISTVHP